MQGESKVYSLLQVRYSRLHQARLKRDRETDLFALEKLVTDIAAQLQVIERIETMETSAVGDDKPVAVASTNWLLNSKAKFLFN
ncbi:hypothetical protein [Ferrimonas lipolytica]|uniref:Uncharacterized protein n=1 Tax=Ferrimonas lipolytica TaxID=2724191 RepID=A0A6H1UBD2_9GAMM|nr:hypothetical protein [Ferrimonas lipolytica]QIZ76365.1 hypothetical protein HER31_05535 [Ferrimonas lipolytica]